MRKVLDTIAVISFLLSGTVIGLIGYAYLTLTNEKKRCWTNWICLSNSN